MTAQERKRIRRIIAAIKAGHLRAQADESLLLLRVTDTAGSTHEVSVRDMVAARAEVYFRADGGTMVGTP